MPPQPPVLVLDSWPILAYLADESAGEKVEDLVAGANKEGVPLLLSTVNAGEVWYVMARNFSKEKADQSIFDIKQLGVHIVDVDWNSTRLAAAFKARGKISYADCFALALAKLRKAALVTGDREFKAFEREVKIIWL